MSAISPKVSTPAGPGARSISPGGGSSAQSANFEIFEALINFPRSIEWREENGGELRLLDQTLLPNEVRYLDCQTAAQVWEAIHSLRVRGAPAIGVAAAYGVVVATKIDRGLAAPEFLSKVDAAAAYLASSRPTAVNLFWALRRMSGVAHDSGASGGEAIWRRLLAEAHAIWREDAEVCLRIGENGAHLVPSGGGVLTHCNAGALATVAFGTALSLLYVARAQGKPFRVFATETRPLFQGARLTAFELNAAKIDVTVVCENNAANLMRTGAIQMVVVGADRIAANGDTANKIGTYSLAVLAKHHGVPFYVAAPSSTFDLSLTNGSQIPIEQRSDAEVRNCFGREVVPREVGVLNPAFDLTEASLLSGIVTEKGLLEPVSAKKIQEILGGGLA
jgi:methylthioribose-1-phosphate isomerase